MSTLIITHIHTSVVSDPYNWTWVTWLPVNWTWVTWLPVNSFVHPTGQVKAFHILFKGHRQRISTVGYKTIFRKMNTDETFLPFTVITNKDYFSRKKLNLRNLLSWYMWFISMVVTSLIGDIDKRILKLVTVVILFVNIVSKYCLFIS